MAKEATFVDLANRWGLKFEHNEIPTSKRIKEAWFSAYGDRVVPDWFIAECKEAFLQYHPELAGELKKRSSYAKARCLVMPDGTTITAEHLIEAIKVRGFAPGIASDAIAIIDDLFDVLDQAEILIDPAEMAMLKKLCTGQAELVQ